MSVPGDHVVVPYATFVERAERRRRMAAALDTPERTDIAVQTGDGPPAPDEQAPAGSERPQRVLDPSPSVR